ncbi:MAG: PfkB family carbohydrate kinase, partial [Crocinitomicaceae bacterium]|nr:PfkB family carbohydrate kinase [Crocinitomicaceae bacterium]
IADVSGAGDTVIAVATACLAAGLSSVQMANIANLAGGLVCESSGVIAIEKDLLLEEVENQLNEH